MFSLFFIFIIYFLIAMTQHLNNSLINKNIKFSDLVSELNLYLNKNDIHSVLIGLSGGADSTLLFLLMREIARVSPDFNLGISHANFHLRGEESIRDQKFVENLVESYSLPNITAFIKEFDTLDYCHRNGVSIEMGARELRHEWWHNLMLTHRFDRIATGHNADDNVETLLLNLLRGSGVRGLKAMPFDDGRVLRPLLGYTRATIQNLLDLSGVSHVEDSTNQDSDYRRNFIRNKVLPLIGEKWPGAAKSITRSIHLLSEENKIIEASLKEILDTSPRQLTIDQILHYPSPLTLIYRWISPYGGSTDVAEEILRVIKSDDIHGQRWNLANGQDKDASSYSLIASNTELRIEDTGGNFLSTDMTEDGFEDFEITHYADISEADRASVFKSDNNEVWLPAHPDNYYWALPKRGDRIRLFPGREKEVSTGRGKSKLISDILKEARVPLAARDKIKILTNKHSGQAIWIPGIRRAGTDLIYDDITEVWRIRRKF